MSALPLQRRQHIDQYLQHYPSTSFHPQNNSLPLRSHNTQYLAPIPSELDIARLSHSPISTTASSPATSTVDFDSPADYYMQRAAQGIQQLSSQDSRYPSLETIGVQQAFWGQQQQQQQQPRSAIGSARIRHSLPSGTFHKRTSSDSTIHSAPYTPTSFPQSNYQPYIVDSDLQQYSPHQHEVFDHQAQSVTSVPKGFPQVSQPLEQSNFFASDQQTGYYNDAQGHFNWNEAMRKALFQQDQFQGQQFNTMEHQREMNGSMHEKLQSFTHSTVPGLGPRTISAICEDELYNVVEPTVPAPITTSTTQRIHKEGNPSSPVNSVFSQRLQTASQGHLEARSASPTASSFGGDRSPFRSNAGLSGSPYDSPTSPGPRMNTASQIREAQRAEAARNALANATRRTSRESSQTVSPKEMTLEYEPENDSQQTMFHSLPSPPRHGQHQKRPSKLKQELTRSTPDENFQKKEDSSNISDESVTLIGSQSIQVPQQYPFIRTSRTSASGMPESSQESNPRFTSTLMSMESTTSEKSESRTSAVNSPELNDDEDDEQEEEDDEEEEASDEDEDIQDEDLQRPNNTRSDGGTYTCTYHGCTQRFETPQKLQKHKKEGHRQGTPSTTVDNRLTQAGPHKCERLNPQTGKPCNSIFSRPYDLTRHEDTIHNAKKQKVRCMICTEEKTFSRNDALTRHMRVVHPEIEFPGKTKRGSR